MIALWTTILLSDTVLFISSVAAYNTNNIQYGYLEPGWKSAIRLTRPTNDLGRMKIDQNDSKQKAKQQKFNYYLEHWTGKWMPEYDPQPTSPPLIRPQDDSIEIHHSVSMGMADPHCDDGKTNLNVDWDNSPVDYTCYGRKITPSYDIIPEWYCEHISPIYESIHRCMNQTIKYDDNIPLYGTHRPVWPVYGEYKFLPPQRWIHSLEHGAVVMLYHPCANPLEKELLKDLIRKCLRRHIITPYNKLDIERPIALVTWGCRLTMSYVDEELVTKFIHKKALHGAETIADDGKYSEGLLTTAAIVSNKDDSQLCPPRD